MKIHEPEKLPQEKSWRRTAEGWKRATLDAYQKIDALNAMTNRLSGMTRTIALELYIADPESAVFKVESGILGANDIASVKADAVGDKIVKLRAHFRNWYQEHMKNEEKKS